MIEVKCEGSTTMQLQEMIPMQGALKHRTQDDIEDIKQSLQEKGLLQPFAIWNGKIIDGHGRHAALMQMSQNEPDILAQAWPVVSVMAATLEEAKAALLEINARYGKITPRGLESFLAGTAIVVPKAVGVKLTPIKVNTPTPQGLPQHRTTVIVKLRVEKDKAAEFSRIINELPYVEIL
jgi:hypothetical protein